MKRFMVALVFISSSVRCYSAPIAAPAPISSVGTPVTIAVSGGAFTRVPSSSTTNMNGRMGIYVNVPYGNTFAVSGVIGDCSTTNATATTIRPIEISTITPSAYFPIREDVCLWLMSLSGSSMNIHYQEVKY